VKYKPYTLVLHALLSMSGKLKLSLLP